MKLNRVAMYTSKCIENTHAHIFSLHLKRAGKDEAWKWISQTRKYFHHTDTCCCTCFFERTNFLSEGRFEVKVATSSIDFTEAITDFSLINKCNLYWVLFVGQYCLIVQLVLHFKKISSRILKIYLYAHLNSNKKFKFPAKKLVNVWFLSISAHHASFSYI